MRERFWPLLGNWTGLERLEAWAGGVATTARASLVLKLDVADSVVVQDYRQVRADGAELYGHGVFLAEPGTENVRWWFFDSNAEPPEPATGSWRADELVLERTTAAGLAEHRFRATGDRFDYQVRLRSDASATWSPYLTGAYRRISGH